MKQQVLWVLSVCMAASGCLAPATDGIILETRSPTHGPLSVQWVSEAAVIASGQSFRVGLWFRHDKSVHTYWKFPGVVGVPTSVEWDLPSGFKAGELQWPTPQISRMAGYRIWGYETDTLLWTVIESPADLKPGTRVRLKGRAGWMACGKTCHPGVKDIELVLPVGEKRMPNPAAAARFAEADALMPQRTQDWTFSAWETPEGFILLAKPVMTRTRPIHAVRFFSSNRQVDSHEPQIMLVREGGELEIHLRRWQYAVQADRLEGVLVSSDGWDEAGEIRSIEIAAPLQKKPPTADR